MIHLNWTAFFLVQVCIWFMVIFDWKRMKQAPKKDRILIGSLLAFATFLSLFDLLNMPGPITILRTIFKPLSTLLET